MRSMNKVFLVGNVGRDANSGTTNTGTQWANISLATSRKGKDDTYVTTWHRVVSFGKIAEHMAKLKKGSTVFIEGELQDNVYKDKEGKEIKSIQILANCVLAADKGEPVQEAGGF